MDEDWIRVRAEDRGEDWRPAVEVLPQVNLPGNVPPNAAAYEAGSAGVALMGLAAWLERRRMRRRYGRRRG